MKKFKLFLSVLALAVLIMFAYDPGSFLGRWVAFASRFRYTLSTSRLQSTKAEINWDKAEKKLEAIEEQYPPFIYTKWRRKELIKEERMKLVLP